MRAALAAVAAISALGSVAAAHADTNKDKADQLFKKGKKLLDKKKYEDACAAFQQSDELDTGIGAKLNVARCFEEWGKIATAMRWYQDAEQMARDHKDDRADKIHPIVEGLDGDVPRLTIKAADDTDAAGVTLDGQPARTNMALAVDPGPHELVWTTAAGEKKTKTIPIERGGSREVKVDLPLKTKAPPHDDKPLPKPETPGDGGGQRIAGIVVGSAGILTVGIASYLTLGARTKYKNALSADCNNDTTMCNEAGLTATHDARHRANIMTIVASVGAAAIAGGIVIYVMAPHGEAKQDRAVTLAPLLGPDGAGLVVAGRF